MNSHIFSQNYIDTFSFIDSLCDLIRTMGYIWGGWVPDIYSNSVLREHDDAEYLISNLYDSIEKIQSVFKSLGWETKIVENGDLKIKKNGMKIQFGHVMMVNDLAEWHHNGNLGKITFPRNWLNDESILFQNKVLHSVKPEFQYVLKLHPEFMNPEWKHRDKDIIDIQVLSKLLGNRDLGDLENLMTSLL